MLGKLDIHMQKTLDPYFAPLTKINSKLVKDLKLIPETLKLLEESIGIKLLDIGLVNDFFGFDTKNTNNESKNKQVELYQPKKLLHSKGN